MKKIVITFLAAATLVACKKNTAETSSDATATTADSTVTVTNDNFAHAMIDMAMQKEFALGADNTWYHHRKPMPLKEQPAPLMNRDTEYSFAILDGRGGVVITLPENDGRYMSLHVVNHDHVTYKVFYGPGRYVIPADSISPFFYANVRMQADASSPEDLKKVNAYQDQLKVEFLNGYKPESFKVTNWDMKSFDSVRNHYVAIAQKEGVRGTMGTVANPVTKENNNRGVSIATGLLPDKDAVYLTQKYEVEKGKIYKATYAVPEMANPKLGFYSVTMYGDDQYLKTDKGSIINNRQIKLNPDGKTFDLYYVPESEFDKVNYPNKLLVPTYPFWTCTRVYMPAASVLDGTYKLPELKAVN
ncbi:DUF1254 domain-containing protein [Flavobacterium agrisoli]|uniref:DUF1254 domain-containing protein n=1 Tax=Flavobacterium agrisoli TaxID=2793066 RepID=A0A934PM02_9FLAO|nr:DUF1254 domain-containing protein [Flavobacterium agrisoli]MBK0369275.1 DUF1254 domain-containing protein [Flavobacterium agrisoli]